MKPTLSFGERYCPACKGHTTDRKGRPCHHCNQTGRTRTKLTRREKLQHSRACQMPENAPSFRA